MFVVAFDVTNVVEIVDEVVDRSAIRQPQFVTLPLMKSSTSAVTVTVFVTFALVPDFDMAGARGAAIAGGGALGWAPPELPDR